jgi:hypothetical protein
MDIRKQSLIYRVSQYHDQLRGMAQLDRAIESIQYFMLDDSNVGYVVTTQCALKTIFLSAGCRGGDPFLQGTKWPHLVPRFKMRGLYLQSPISHNAKFKHRDKFTFIMWVKVRLNNIITGKGSRTNAFSLTNAYLKENHYRLGMAIKYDLTLDGWMKLVEFFWMPTPFIRSRAHCKCI